MRDEPKECLRRRLELNQVLEICIIPVCSFSDIDECSLGNNSCPAHAHCVNVVGSYACECFHGYHGNHCYDVDECELGIHLCDKHANCINTIGSYKCACQVGFHDDGNSCKDVNECKAGSHNCTQDARCLNTDGSYRCV